MAEAVEGDGGDDDDTGDDFLNPIGEAHLGAAGADDGHDEGADEAAEDGAFATGEATAADDDCGDDIELESDGDGGVTDREAGELHGTGEAGEDTAERVDGDLDLFHGDAAEAGGEFIGADGEDVATEAGIAEGEADGDGGEDEEPDADGDEHPALAGAERGEEAIEPGFGGVDALFMGDAFSDAAGEEHHAERDDEGDDAQSGDEEAVQVAEGTAEKDGC